MEDEENLAQTSSGALWKNNLYLLQEQAPKPKMIRCRRIIENKPGRYGEEFHGLIDRTEAEDLLKEAGEGAYLVRESKRSLDAYTLCMIFEGHVLNYKLYYDGAHYVGEKRFDNLHDLVADGLICMYVDKHAADYIRRMTDEVIYEHSPYQIYNKSVEKQGVQRAHSFAQQTFKMQYCDYCRNFLWGLVQQGVRCVDCGFAAHKKCSEKALMDCQPEAKYVKRIFAIDLTTLCIAHKIGIPSVVSSCIREVETRGLTVEGIYRVSASHEQMERLKRQYDSQHNVNLSQVEDIHTVCGLLKLYLRLLPQQLVPFSVYKSLLQAYTTTTTANNNHDRTRALRKALRDLCETNSRTLKAILTHLKRVSEYSQENKMSAENLSTIFSPTLFCTGNTPALPQQQHMLLHFLILNPNLVPDYL